MSDHQPPKPRNENLSAAKADLEATAGADAPVRLSYCERNPWLVFVIPLVVYLASGTLESALPAPEDAKASQAAAELAPPPATDAASEAAEETPPASTGMFGMTRAAYPLIYSLRLALTLGVMLLAWPGYREFPFRVSLLAIVVGVIGVALWVGLCELRLEQSLLQMLGLESWLGARVAYNPLAELAEYPTGKYLFLVVRLIGFVLVAPVIEEFFLRGFAMRFVIQEQWWLVPFGTLTSTAVAVATIYGPLTHPGEFLAAAVWFSLVTWLMHRTRNIWDCVLAHAVTNGLLAAYVLSWGAWHLW